MSAPCPVCKAELGGAPFRLRYEGLVYSFDREACKRIFQENPDRYLGAGGEILPEPR